MFIEQKDFNEIKKSLPINAVELLILDSADNVLLFKRTNEPAKDQWWLPGGRVLFGETRLDAAKRLLKDECGIVAYDIDEIEMFEYSVKNNTDNYYQHIISTVYQVKIVKNDIKMDSQSSEYSWKHSIEWETLVEHDFLKQLLNKFQEGNPTSFFMEESVLQNKTEFISEKLYAIILKSLSIPCVDILIRNKAGEILLVKRKNEPAKDKWWVPGGRVLFGEKRINTAKRKLIEECGLEGKEFKKIRNFEFIFNNSKINTCHNIATLFEVTVANENKVVLDDQSSEFSWRSPSAWLQLPLHDFIRDVIENEIYIGKSEKIYQ